MLFYQSIIETNLREVDKFFDPEYGWGGYAGGCGITLTILDYLLMASSYVNDRGK